MNSFAAPISKADESSILFAEWNSHMVVFEQSEFDAFIKIYQNPRSKALQAGAIAAMILFSHQANATTIQSSESYCQKMAFDTGNLNPARSSRQILPSTVDSSPVDVTSKTEETVADKAELKNIFNGLAKKWKEETRGYSLTSQKYSHPAYQSILVLGPEVIPFIIRDLQENGGRWFEALKALARRDDITKPSDTYEDAVKAWVKWGQDNKMI